MNSPDKPGSPPPRELREWAELEQDPTFQEILKEILGELIENKIFGKKFMDDYAILMVRKGVEDLKPGLNSDEIIEESVLKDIENPLIPEVNKLQEEMADMTVKELIEYAKKKGAALTEQEMTTAKREALDLWVAQAKKDTRGN